MTWPFENDTSAIVKKLAKRNVSSNRIFCFFNVLTIALAISLIVGISLFQQGSKISEQKILNQMQQATIGGLTAEQIEVLKKEPDLEDISRISTRRKEFGILESIGMTKKQLKKMLLHESVLLIIPCLIITVVVGTLIGYLLVRILSANGLTYFQYTFPFIPLLIYGVCLIITPIIISAICLKIQCRNSLVERIKMAD